MTAETDWDRYLDDQEFALELFRLAYLSHFKGHYKDGTVTDSCDICVKIKEAIDELRAYIVNYKRINERIENEKKNEKK